MTDRVEELELDPDDARSAARRLEEQLTATLEADGAESVDEYEAALDEFERRANELSPPPFAETNRPCRREPARGRATSPTTCAASSRGSNGTPNYRRRPSGYST